MGLGGLTIRVPVQYVFAKIQYARKMQIPHKDFALISSALLLE